MAPMPYVVLLFLISIICIVGHGLDGHHDEHDEDGRRELLSTHDAPHAHQHSPVLCGTRNPTSKELERDQIKMEALKELLDQEIPESTRHRSLQDGTIQVNVPTYVHVISAPDGTGQVSDASIDQQMRVLNLNFASTPFQFTLQETRRVVNQAWSSQGESKESEYKQALRVGDETTLNVYYLTFEKEGLLGFATFPFWYPFEPVLDGVVNDYRTIPGGRFTDYNAGMTTVHEVGHWLGLFHTFDGNDCNGPNDFVEDTPVHSGPSFECTTGLDTCSGGGPDPVANIMNYLPDYCDMSFTAGQADRMYLHWLMYRSQNEICEPGKALFELEVVMDSYCYETYWSLQNSAGDLMLQSPEITFLYNPEYIAGSVIVKDLCIPSGTYTFTFGDTYGDGLTGGSVTGSYKISLNGDQISQGSAFTFQESSTFVVQAGTPSPNPPTPSPVTPTPFPTLMITPRPTPVPTPPLGDTLEVIIFISFDQWPYEIGWSLECGSMLLADNPFDTYSLEEYYEWFVFEVFDVSIGETCTFTIRDSLEDGLFCSDGDIANPGCGYYEIGVGNGILLPATFFSGANAAETFIVTLPSATLEVSVVVFFDAYPEEIGLSLVCGSETLLEIPSGSFSPDEYSFAPAVITFDVPIGQVCNFAIVDSYGDGLFCFNDEVCAFYALLIDDNNVVENTNFDGSFSEEVFVVESVVQTPPPTPGPTNSPVTVAPAASSDDLVELSIAIQLDDYPEEIGLSFVCDGIDVFPRIEPGTYGSEDEFAYLTGTYFVQEGASCVFTIEDSFGDGLFCFSICGQYAIFYGNDLESASEFAIITWQLFESDVETISFIATNTPAISPSFASPATPSLMSPSGLEPGFMPAPLPPVVDGVSVVVRISLDEFPYETGLLLICDENILIDVPFNSFGVSDSLSTIEQSYEVPQDASCVFSLFDSFGDGLCSNFFQCGSYELYSNGELIDSGVDFLDIVEVRFRAGGVTPSPIATMTPNPTTATLECPAGSFPFLGSCFCFSGRNLVQTKGKGTIQMKDLQIGDQVLVVDGKYEPIYSFGHYLHHGMHEYIVLNDELEISKSHMIYVSGRGFVPAGSVQKGDLLMRGGAEDTAVPVTSIRMTQSEGMYAPFTPSGTLVVSGLLTSSFISMQEGDSANLEIGGGLTGLSWHWLAHTFEFPHRVVCHYLGQCIEEHYSGDTGVLLWLVLPHKLALWLNEQTAFVKVAVWVPILFMMLAFASVEALFLSSSYAIAAVVLVIILLGWMAKCGITFRVRK